MKILAISYPTAKKAKQEFIDKNYPVIAFLDSDTPMPDLFVNTPVDHITLRVDDCIDGDPMFSGGLFSGGRPLVMFNESHARIILDFTEKHKDSDTMIVHCMGGICRSGAVAWFLNNKFNFVGSEDDLFFKTYNNGINPNIHIIEMLRKVDGSGLTKSNSVL